MQADAERSKDKSGPAGRLAIVGSGIAALAHLTLETIGYIEDADIVFYHANSGVTAAHIHELNANAVDLYKYYGEGKLRNITYVQMAELMLREVRRGRSVVGLFHGHPGYFVKSGRRALAIAQMEGYETALLPGISATDCLFSDLRIDPGVIGVQILKAGHVLREDACLATANHVVLVQVGSVGDNTFSFTGFKHAKFEQFFNKLISIYGAGHDSVYYVAPIFPGLDPVIVVRTLGEYRSQKTQDTVSAATLYLPPAGVRVESLTTLQGFRNKAPYGRFELDAIELLDTHTTPEGFKKRGASKAMLRAMMELGTTPSAVRNFRRRPDEFLARHGDLTSNEREALLSRETGRMRSVTTTVAPSGNGSEAATNHKDISQQTAVPSDRPLWTRYRYYDVFRAKFSPFECEQIIELHHDSDHAESQLYDSAGSKVRDCSVFWVRRSAHTEWLFDRVKSAVSRYNEAYAFELLDDVGAAQLTRYCENQQYGWHMDLGENQPSLRKVSAVVELTPEADRVGGGIEVFYGETADNRVRLDAGDIVVFPSFIMHRASKVERGVRWSLVFWFNGPTPFR
jgi:precorrin-6B methylase 1